MARRPGRPRKDEDEDATLVKVGRTGGAVTEVALNGDNKSFNYFHAVSICVTL